MRNGIPAEWSRSLIIPIPRAIKGAWTLNLGLRTTFKVIGPERSKQ